MISLYRAFIAKQAWRLAKVSKYWSRTRNRFLLIHFKQPHWLLRKADYPWCLATLKIGFVIPIIRNEQSTIDSGTSKIMQVGQSLHIRHSRKLNAVVLTKLKVGMHCWLSIVKSATIPSPICLGQLS